jgi:hypothetical protein
MNPIVYGLFLRITTAIVRGRYTCATLYSGSTLFVLPSLEPAELVLYASEFPDSKLKKTKTAVCTMRC